jgi:hypothetical protein
VNAQELLQWTRDRSIWLYWENGHVCLKAVQGVVTDELRTRLKARQEELTFLLVEELRQRSDVLRIACCMCCQYEPGGIATFEDGQKFPVCDLCYLAHQKDPPPVGAVCECCGKVLSQIRRSVPGGELVCLSCLMTLRGRQESKEV